MSTIRNEIRISGAEANIGEFLAYIYHDQSIVAGNTEFYLDFDSYTGFNRLNDFVSKDSVGHFDDEVYWYPAANALVVYGPSPTIHLVAASRRFELAFTVRRVNLPSDGESYGDGQSRWEEIEISNDASAEIVGERSKAKIDR